MVILISVIGIVLLAFTWVLLAPLTLCVDTNQPTNIIIIELKGIMKYRIHVQDDGIFFHSRIFFFKSKNELFKKKKSPVDRKKKLTEKRGKKRGLKSSGSG